MAIIHIIQQGKGGVGKSMIASMLYQILGFLGKTVVAYDTDPVNQTFGSYKEFDVTVLKIMKGDNIDPRKFDDLIEGVFNAPEGAHIIVDNGASSFVALDAYIRENDIINLFKENEHTVYFHTVITGGQAIVDTVAGLSVLATNFPKTPIVVWLNHFFGEIELAGKTFEEFKVYKEHCSKLSAIIDIPQGNAATIGKDLEKLFALHQSFAAGINSASTIAVRSRLNKYWNELVGLVQHADFVNPTWKLEQS